MTTTIAIILVIFAIVVLAACSLQEKMIFHPEQLAGDYQFEFDGNWQETNYEVEEGIKLNAIEFTVKNPKGVVLYFHGNAGNLASWGYVGLDFVKFGYNVVVVDYRGYGKSSSKIKSEKQLYRDVQFVYSQLKKKYDENDIVVYGRSIGTGVASYLSANNEPGKLILETPYYSLKALVADLYIKPVSWIVMYNLSNSKHLKNTKCPVYIIHGTNDGLIPLEHAKKLNSENKGSVLAIIDGGEHNNLPEFPEYHFAIAEILK